LISGKISFNNIFFAILVSVGGNKGSITILFKKKP